MRKEYSDLPDNQKITYYKRGVVYGIFVFVPVLLLFGSLFGIIFYYSPTPTESQTTNSTANIPETAKDTSFSFAMSAFLIIGFAGMIGFTTVGTALGDWVCDKLKLYTDFQLEAAEKRVADIKKELSK